MADDPTPADAPESADPNAIVPCRHLRSKGMIVYNGGAYMPPHDEYDNTVFWCTRTMKGFGPDDEMVGREDCTAPERTCFEPF